MRRLSLTALLYAEHPTPSDPATLHWGGTLTPRGQCPQTPSVVTAGAGSSRGRGQERCRTPNSAQDRCAHRRTAPKAGGCTVLLVLAQPCFPDPSSPFEFSLNPALNSHCPTQLGAVSDPWAWPFLNKKDNRPRNSFSLGHWSRDNPQDVSCGRLQTQNVPGAGSDPLGTEGWAAPTGLPKRTVTARGWWTGRGRGCGA